MILTTVALLCARVPTHGTHSEIISLTCVLPGVVWAHLLTTKQAPGYVYLCALVPMMPQASTPTPMIHLEITIPNLVLGGA